MAQLNLRERLIEATIAYVGADGAAHLAHVMRDVQHGRAGVLEELAVDQGRVLALDWRPRDGPRLNDCELAVKLLSADGAVGSERLQRILADADGLVLALDPDADGGEERGGAVEAVRVAVARKPGGNLPVVEARGARGEGAMETLQRAVDTVLESMQKQQEPRAAARAHGAPRAEGNPLLGALRQMLESAIREQVGALELRIIDQLERQATARNEDARAADERVTTLLVRMDRVELAVTEAGKRAVEASEGAAMRQAAGTRELAEGLARAVKADTAALVDELQRRKKSWF